jgi:putative CocE/NonD family hydrolase
MKNSYRSLSLATATWLLVSLVSASATLGQSEPLPSSALFEKRVEQIAVRDGVTLNTEIYIPKRGDGPWPILLERTPYGIAADEDGYFRSLGARYRDLLQDGYIFVIQDIRGRYGSKGTFVMQRPPRTSDDPRAANEAGVDEGTDTYDTIDWLLENLDSHNGRVGMLGISYGGWLTTMSLIEPHPALRAASPQASPSDMFKGDDFLHNGAFRLAASFGYVALMETGNENAPFAFDQHDAYEWYLELGALSNVDDKYFFGEKPTWNDFMANTSYTEYWQRQTCLPYLEDVYVPTLNVAGWWDAEDFYGPMSIYQRFEESDDKNQNYLVVGPWRHGGWARADGDTLGELSFQSDPAQHFREQIERSFFSHYLIEQTGKEQTPWPAPEAQIFETGSNLWRGYQQWPPPTTQRALYLQAAGGLGFSPPEAPTGSGADPGYDAYVSDPAKPVPYVPRPIPPFWQGGQALWKVTDQRFVDGRPDVLTYVTPALEDEITLAGPIIAELFAATTGTDADWVVKLIDVFPEDYPDRDLRGFQLMIADEVFRARFRNSFERPEAVPANQTVDYRFSLGDRHHTFERGHRIMVQIQSTWFPLIGRNPQTFVEIPQAAESDYQKAEHRIHRSGKSASRLILPVQ